MPRPHWELPKSSKPGLLRLSQIIINLSRQRPLVLVLEDWFRGWGEFSHQAVSPAPRRFRRGSRFGSTRNRPSSFTVTEEKNGKNARARISRLHSRSVAELLARVVDRFGGT